MLHVQTKIPFNNDLRVFKHLLTIKVDSSFSSFQLAFLYIKNDTVPQSSSFFPA